MKNLNTYITEKLKIVHKSYSCAPQTKIELKKIIEERLEKNPNANLNDIDVSGITDMSYLFYGLNPHNIDISQWDVSNVEDMKFMFYRCEYFNSDLSNWDVSNVKYSFCMFEKCLKFNSDLSNWNVSKIYDMDDMFFDCRSMAKLPTWYTKH